MKIIQTVEVRQRLTENSKQQLMQQLTATKTTAGTAMCAAHL
ncbi:MAG: hypothetical protein KatS3mg080_0171 [Anoxybacillus sp.]|nr:MAG: hypothetical protein KatS3mg080_0171 [Anoxybacillus sp.]